MFLISIFSSKEIKTKTTFKKGPCGKNTLREMLVFFLIVKLTKDIHKENRSNPFIPKLLQFSQVYAAMTVQT